MMNPPPTVDNPVRRGITDWRRDVCDWGADHGARRPSEEFYDAGWTALRANMLMCAGAGGRSENRPGVPYNCCDEPGHGLRDGRPQTVSRPERLLGEPAAVERQLQRRLEHRRHRGGPALVAEHRRRLR